MSVDFGRIKKYSKASNDIDEKLEYLNKEFKKTGLCEIAANSTSGIYVRREEEPNPAHAIFSNASFNGKPFGMTSFSGKSIGGSTNASGHSISPDGLRVAKTYQGSVNGFQAKPPGYQRTPTHRKVGAFLWYWNGTHYRWLEWKYDNQYESDAGEWAQWKQGMFPYLDPIIGDASFDPNLLAAIRAAGGGGAAFPNPDDITPPTNLILFQNELGDPGFLPINIPDLTKQAFEYLKKKAEEFLYGTEYENELDTEKDYETNRENQPDVTSGLIPPNPYNNYAPDIAGSIAANEVRTYENDDIPQVQKDKLIKNMNWTDIGGNIPITSEPTNYSDDNFYVNEKGEVTPHSGDSKEKYPPNTREHQGGTTKYRGNPLGNAGQYHFELVVPKDGGEPYFNYEDHAYYNPNSTDKSEVPKRIQKLFAKISQATGKQLPGYPDGIKGDVVKKVKISLSDALKSNPNIKNSPKLKKYFKKYFKESLDESVKLGHFEPEVLNVDINKLRKGILPEFPKDPPPEMIDGYAANSRLAPKKLELPPFIKVTKKDIAQNHLLTDKEISDFMNDINMINDYIKKNPAELKYAMIRYPKNDIRLAQLNFKMDQMKAASEEYMETHFPENQKLFDKIKKKIKNTIAQTDPKNFKDVKLPKFDKTNLEEFKKKKEVYSRYFKKPVKIKKLFRK